MIIVTLLEAMRDLLDNKHQFAVGEVFRMGGDDGGDKLTQREAMGDKAQWKMGVISGLRIKLIWLPVDGSHFKKGFSIRMPSTTWPWFISSVRIIAAFFEYAAATIKPSQKDNW